MKRPDPSQREDRHCARHGCQKPLPDRAIWHGDPFCSNTCASRHHGVGFSRGLLPDEKTRMVEA